MLMFLKPFIKPHQLYWTEFIKHRQAFVAMPRCVRLFVCLPVNKYRYLKNKWPYQLQF